MGVVITVNLVVGTVLLMMGGAFVPIFLGLDVAAISVAFAASYRQARRRERVQVSADEVSVFREDDASSHAVWTSPTAFTRVRLEHTGRYGSHVRLMMSAKRLTIGAALGPQEREGLAEEIDEAIRRARAERHQP
jgi:uncharacterized membrane protein